jgi:hypothetical protein
MNVKELIEELQRHSPTTRVLLASDEEGNSFHNVGSFGTVQSSEGVIFIYPSSIEMSPLDDVDDE